MGNAAGDTGAWLSNVLSSVLIVFVNKWLMDPNWGFGFVFATSLCSLHFFASSITVRISEALGYSQHVGLPLKDTIVFSLVAGTSIATLNLSLLVNSVGFYQISKLLIIPFVCLVEYVSLRRRFTALVVVCIAVVVVGVGIVTVNDIGGSKLSVVGLTIAAMSVVTSGMQQIMCGTMQRRCNVTSTQLLSNTAPVQGALLLITGPFIDKMVTSQWIVNYTTSSSGMQCLMLSCAVAVMVNISQFMCLGRFSAVTFQVLGHTKTILVLVVGWYYFGDIITPRKLLGMSLAVAGMVGYGYATSRSGGTTTILVQGKQPAKSKGLTRDAAPAAMASVLGKSDPKDEDAVEDEPPAAWRHASAGGADAHADWRSGVEAGEPQVLARIGGVAADDDSKQQ